MATIFNEQRKLGIRLVADGTTMFNGLPVIGVRETADGLLFVDNQRVLGVDVLDADQAMYNDQPVRGAVLIEDARTMYNGERVTPVAGTVEFSGIVGGRFSAGAADVALFTPNANRVGPYQYRQHQRVPVQSFIGATGNVYMVRVKAPNWHYGLSNVQGAETDAGGPITVKMSIAEVFGSLTVPLLFKWGGADSVVVQPGENAWADWLAVNVVPGTDAEIIAWLSFDANTFIGGQHRRFSALGEGAAGALTTADPTGSAAANRGITSNNNNSYGPIVMQGRIKAPASVNDSVALFGDSILRNSSDANGDDAGYTAWGERLCRALNLGFTNLSVSGRSLETAFASTSRAFDAVDGVASLAIEELGANSAGLDFNLFIQYKQTIWARMRAAGMKPIATTMTPYTDSSDGFTSVDGQIPHLNSYIFTAAGTMGQYNTWLRNGAGGNTDLAGYLDVADVVMSSRDSFKWRVDLGVPTTDGLHPLTVLHAAIATSPTIQAQFNAARRRP